MEIISRKIGILNFQLDLGYLQFNYTRSLVLSTVLFGNIGFTLIEAWPHISTKRVLTIVTTLFILPFAFCNIPVLQHYFHLHELSNVELTKTLILGLLASIPTFIFRVVLMKENGEVKV